jgi:hypothetical protein
MIEVDLRGLGISRSIAIGPIARVASGAFWGRFCGAPTETGVAPVSTNRPSTSKQIRKASAALKGPEVSDLLLAFGLKNLLIRARRNPAGSFT